MCAIECLLVPLHVGAHITLDLDITNLAVKMPASDIIQSAQEEAGNYHRLLSIDFLNFSMQSNSMNHRAFFLQATLLPLA